MDIAGPNQEIGWQELKRILDHSMRDGESLLFNLFFCFISILCFLKHLTLKKYLLVLSYIILKLNI